MQLEFKKIDKHNYEACVELTVHKEQEDFVATNWWSLLEDKYEEGERHPFGIYDGETMIGFLMYTFYPADEDYPKDSWWLERFMIDKAHQNKGFGEASLVKFMEYFQSRYGNTDLRLATEPENDVAIKLYEKIGFVKTGEEAAGEIVFHIKL